MQNKSLKKRIITPIIIFLVILITIMIAYPLAKFSDYVRTGVRNKMVLAANNTRNYMSNCDQATRAAAVSGSITPDIVRATKERDTKEIIRHLVPMLELYRVDFLAVANEEGTVLASTHDPDYYDFSTWFKEIYTDVFNGAVYTAHMKGITAKVSTVACSPIYDSDSTLIGIITAGIRLDTNYTLDKLKEHVGTDFSVYVDEKMLATTIIKDGKRITDRLIDPQIAGTVLRDKKEFIGKADFMGDNYNVFYMPLLNSNGEAFAIISAEHSNAEFSEIESAVLTGSIIIGILGLICSVLILLFIIEKITKPITQMKSIVSEINICNTNADINSSFAIEDEIGVLISNIFFLIDIIRSMAGDLSQYKQNLIVCSDIKFRTDASKYRGIYKEIIDVTEYLCSSISSTSRVASIMNNLHFMTIVVSLDYHLIFVNNSLAKTFDLDVDDYKGKKCYKTLRGLDEPCPICLLPSMMDDKENLPYQDYDFLYDETFCLWLSGRGSILRWIDGSLVYVQTLNDATERKRAQEQLYDALETAEAASKAKSEFLANMSHELRTPLNVILGIVNLQMDEDGTPENIKENLIEISRAGSTMLGIINDVLDISKIESGKFTFAPVEYHMASLLNDTSILITTLIGDKPIKFNLDINENLPSMLLGDDLRVKQIIYNLLSNAIKYTHSGTVELGVNCEREGDNYVWMEITVRDTGIGINPEGLKNLFSDYNQVDTIANRKVIGTGLGLAITKKLVDNMDGTITVDSIYGVGSTFRARIRQGFIEGAPPICPTIVKNLRSLRYGENKRKIARNLVRCDLSHAKVLVVDDMQTNLNVSAGLMRKYKMQVDCVTSGQAAIDRIVRAEPIYNAIFMDHMMPEMDGIEATGKIRALDTDYAKTIPIIALTANAITGTEELFYESGFQAYIAKPIDIMRLDCILKRWINNDQTDNSLDITPNNTNISDTSAFDSPEEKNNIEIPGLDTNKGLSICNGDTNISDTSAFDSPEEKNNIEIPGLDTNKGLSICNGDMNTYTSVLRAYADDLFEVLERMRDVNEDTLPIYTTTVHGIKGSSAIIGAETIEEIAVKLELMARNGDIAGIQTINDCFLKETEHLLTAIKEWLIINDDNVNT